MGQQDEPKIFFGDHGIDRPVRADGMIDDKVEDTIREIEPSAIKATLVIRKRINKSGLEVAIINNMGTIIDTGHNSEDVVNKYVGNDNAFAHDMSDKPIIMGY
ncbi:Uncharacterized protein TCM_011113 [Theobroma cacao]|uniref:Uncharacterized protein n=1 Tax=Theobroma cacao TaxID=3641 RepID=A0A061E9B0_THECC|nr:Uncharacterized protein TCM_011113 [Theobroma cacao]